MTYLLDTDTCIYIMKMHPALVNKLAEIAAEDVAVSAITVSELNYGVRKSQHQAKNQRKLDMFLKPLTILDYDQKAVDEYGIIRFTLEKAGRLIGPLDMLIAAHALSRNKILVTNNEKEFQRIDRLEIENWLNSETNQL